MASSSSVASGMTLESMQPRIQWQTEAQTDCVETSASILIKHSVIPHRTPCKIESAAIHGHQGDDLESAEKKANPDSKWERWLGRLGQATLVALIGLCVHFLFQAITLLKGEPAPLDFAHQSPAI